MQDSSAITLGDGCLHFLRRPVGGGILRLGIFEGGIPFFRGVQWCDDPLFRSFVDAHVDGSVVVLRTLDRVLVDIAAIASAPVPEPRLRAERKTLFKPGGALFLALGANLLSVCKTRFASIGSGEALQLVFLRIVGRV